MLKNKLILDVSQQKGKKHEPNDCKGEGKNDPWKCCYLKKYLLLILIKNIPLTIMFTLNFNTKLILTWFSEWRQFKWNFGLNRTPFKEKICIFSLDYKIFSIKLNCLSQFYWHTIQILPDPSVLQLQTRSANLTVIFRVLVPLTDPFSVQLNLNVFISLVNLGNYLSCQKCFILFLFIFYIHQNFNFSCRKTQPVNQSLFF